MRLTEPQALELLQAHSHGVLGTLHADRGVDLIPIVYAAHGSLVGSPVDVVKPKSSVRLQRVRNLELDSRASLLIERWDHHDWSKLWWVRAELRWLSDGADGRSDALADRLAASYPQYQDKPFASILAFEIKQVTGWSANQPEAS